MRTLEQIDADLKALGRPMHPGVASVTNPRLVPAWRVERDAWTALNPGGEERYVLLLEEREAVDVETARARWARAKANDISRGVGVPELVRRELALNRPTPAFAGADKWLASDKPWLILAGPVGTGKSCAAGYALERSLKGQQTAAWISSSSISSSAGGFGGELQLRRLQCVDVLVVDDFGTEHLSPWAESVFHELLAARHENALRTVMTTNLSREAFRARIGPRLADRIAHACHFIECLGESLR